MDANGYLWTELKHYTLVQGLNELNYLLTNDINMLLIDVLLNDCVNWIIGVD